MFKVVIIDYGLLESVRLGLVFVAHSAHQVSWKLVGYLQELKLGAHRYAYIKHGDLRILLSAFFTQRKRTPSVKNMSIRMSDFCDLVSASE